MKKLNIFLLAIVITFQFVACTKILHDNEGQAKYVSATNELERGGEQ